MRLVEAMISPIETTRGFAKRIILQFISRRTKGSLPEKTASWQARTGCARFAVRGQRRLTVQRCRWLHRVVRPIVMHYDGVTLCATNRYEIATYRQQQRIKK